MLQLKFPLDELPESWIEVVQDKLCPVRSAKGHRIRRALRWADTALRAERAPAGLAPQLGSRGLGGPGRRGVGSVPARLGSGRGRRTGLTLAARRQADISGPPPCAPQPPDGPDYLAETIGR